MHGWMGPSFQEKSMPWSNEANLACGAPVYYLSSFICLFHPISLYLYVLIILKHLTCIKVIV